DFVDHAVDPALPWLLTVGPPHGAKRAMFRAAADCLHRRPHVSPLWQEVPARGHELLARDSTALVDRSWLAGATVGDHLLPDQVAVAAYDGVGSSLSCRFVGKERRVNAAEHHPCAARAHLASDLIPAERVAGVDANADDVAFANCLECE